MSDDDSFYYMLDQRSADFATDRAKLYKNFPRVSDEEPNR